MQKILIPIDGSELSLDALRHALRLKQQGLAAEFVLANVQEPASLYEMITMPDPQRLQGMAASAGDHLLERAREMCDAAGASYECEIATGDPAHTLLDIAERYSCDSIIVGAKGHGGLLGPHLGSVSQVLAETSGIPVTVVKHAAFESAGDSQRTDAAKPADPEVVVGLA